MQELIDMGIDVSKASIYWGFHITDPKQEYPKLVLRDKNFMFIEKVIPTFILQDILEILPKPCYLNCMDNDFYQCEIPTKIGSISTNGSSPLNAAFNMLKWCKQNKYI